jgi:hypothetical protein
MKTLFLSVLITLFSTIAWAQEVKRLSEPVQTTEEYEVFGSPMNLDEANPVSLTSAIEKQQEEVTILAEVKEVCGKKGCFFVADDGKHTARVTFVDYSFFIPTDSKGKKLIFKGVLSEKVITEKEAKHFAEDAGENPDKVVGEQKEYSIVASSVAVPRS